MGNRLVELLSTLRPEAPAPQYPSGELLRKGTNQPEQVDVWFNRLNELATKRVRIEKSCIFHSAEYSSPPNEEQKI